MRGVVQSGGTGGDARPVSSAQVTLLMTTDGDPVVVGRTHSDNSGSFRFDTTTSKADGVFYVTAVAGNGVTLMALLSALLPSDIVVNELTTVGAVFCTAQFLAGGAIRGNDFSLQVAAAMNTNLVDAVTGKSSAVLLRSPNADETNALRSTRSLANLLAFCVRDPAAGCPLVFNATTPPGAPRPTDTIQAMLNIARYPANQVSTIFDLSKKTEPFLPSLTKAPDAWTLAVKVNDSGNDAHLFGGPANLVFDQDGNAWITNNVVQGTPNSTEWSIVLRRDGTPAPMSPFSGAGLVGAGFGIDIDSKKRIWVGSFGWGSSETYPSGTVSLFESDGTPIAGYIHDVYRVQQTVVDKYDNVWMASYGYNSVVVYLGGDDNRRLVYKDPEEPEDSLTFLPFGIAIAADGTAWVTDSDAERGGVRQLAIAGNVLKLLTTTYAGRTVKGIAIDSAGNIWIGSGGDDYVYLLDPSGKVRSKYRTGGMDGPWGVFIDGNDNLWVANFGPLRPGSDFTGRLTCLAGANAPNPGAAISPVSTGYTLPSAGEQVLLHDGTPLYGAGAAPCYIPMMRTTGANVDQAGNVWTCNNWKPNFDVDRDSNPGGDGMVIFIGLGKPPKNRWA